MVETLVAAGVRRIYGVVGDSLNGMLEEIRRRLARATKKRLRLQPGLKPTSQANWRSVPGVSTGQ